MVDLLEIVCRKTGQFHHRVEVKAVVKHSLGNFEFAFIAT
jgi:hypothetical protein